MPNGAPPHPLVTVLDGPAQGCQASNDQGGSAAGTSAQAQLSAGFKLSTDPHFIEKVPSHVWACTTNRPEKAAWVLVQVDENARACRHPWT